MLCLDEESINMLNYRVKHLIDGLRLDFGETITLNCPCCGGYKKFSVSNLDGTVVYNCYRASCNVKGAVNTSLTSEQIQRKLKLDKPSKNKNPDFVLPEYITVDIINNAMKRFINRWELRNVRLYYDVKDKRAVFPIFENNKMVGAIGRALNNVFPKWLRYDKTANYYSHVLGSESSVAVVVEDVISAIVLAQEIPQVTGVAILGTSLNEKHKEYLKGYKTIVVALDPDASDKTITYTKELKSYCTNSMVLAHRLEDDLKYKRQNDLDKIKEITHE